MAKTTKATKKTKKPVAKTVRVKGNKLVATVKKLIAEGNVRRISINDKDGKTILIIPLTIGVIGAVLAPILAAVGAIAAVVTDCSITVERTDK